MANLSHGAQAVLDAYYTEADLRNRAVTDCEMLAAALRAAADQLYDSPSQDYLWGIAAELDGTQPTAQPEPEGPTQPIPVSERLPGPEDRDAEGRCWYGAPDRPGAVACWDLEYEPATDDTHWLPAHALPVPTSENDFDA